jgi:hypothetical protein
MIEVSGGGGGGAGGKKFMVLKGPLLDLSPQQMNEPPFGIPQLQ